MAMSGVGYWGESRYLLGRGKREHSQTTGESVGQQSKVKGLFAMGNSLIFSL